LRDVLIWLLMGLLCSYILLLKPPDLRPEQLIYMYLDLVIWAGPEGGLIRGPLLFGHSTGSLSMLINTDHCLL